MKAPKILPWLARKAGLDDALALELWQRAAQESERLCGCSEGASYHAAAVSRLLDLIEYASDVASAEPTPRLREQAGWGAAGSAFRN